MVGPARFELATPTPPSVVRYQTALRPDLYARVHVRKMLQSQPSVNHLSPYYWNGVDEMAINFLTISISQSPGGHSLLSMNKESSSSIFHLAPRADLSIWQPNTGCCRVTLQKFSL